MSIAEFLGYFASLLVFATFYMKTMLPLRAIAIGSNVAFLAYAFAEHLYPVMALHAALLPLNLHRFLQIRRMIRKVEQAATGELNFEELLPHMTYSRRATGETLFRKGDFADALYYIAGGSIALQELGKSVGAGSIVGEIAIFAPDGRRMATAMCETDCDVYSLSAAKIQELYYQHPAFGFTLLRLIVMRLLQDTEKVAAP